MPTSERRDFNNAEPLSQLLTQSRPFLVAAAACLAAIFIVFNIVVGTSFYGCVPRLAATLAYFHGYDFYYPADSGPILNTIYPPFAYLVYSPAAIALVPFDALLIGCIIAVALYFAPVFAFFGALRGRLNLPAYKAIGAACVFCFFSFHIYGLYYSAFSIHADAPALGFSAAACALIVLSDAPRRATTLFLAALASAAALLSKQTVLPLIPVLFVVIALTEGYKAALRFALFFLIQMAVLLLILSLFLDMRALALNVWILPSRHPWYNGKNLMAVVMGAWVFFQANHTLLFAVAFVLFGYGRGRRRDLLFHLILLAIVGSAIWNLHSDMAYYTHETLIIGQLYAFIKFDRPGTIHNLIWIGYIHAMGLIVFLALLDRMRPRAFKPAEIRAALKNNPQWLFLILAACQLPFSLLGFCKVGGHYNSFSVTIYPLLIFVCYALVQPIQNGSKGWDFGLPWTIILVIVFLGSLAQLTWDKYPFFRAAMASNSAQGDYYYIQKHGNETYFPWDPLAPLMVNGKLYHYSYGVYDRELAGYPPLDSNVRAYLPEGMKKVASEASLEAWLDTQYILKFIPGCIKAPADPELQGDNIYTVK